MRRAGGPLVYMQHHTQVEVQAGAETGHGLCTLHKAHDMAQGGMYLPCTALEWPCVVPCLAVRSTITM